jgi:hypothetical protein
VGKVFLEVGKSVTYDLGKCVYSKISKKLNKRKRRLAWKNSQSESDLEKII